MGQSYVMIATPFWPQNSGYPATPLLRLHLLSLGALEADGMSEEQAMQLAEESDRLSAEVNGQSLKGRFFFFFSEDLLF